MSRQRAVNAWLGKKSKRDWVYAPRIGVESSNLDASYPYGVDSFDKDVATKYGTTAGVSVSEHVEGFSHKTIIKLVNVAVPALANNTASAVGIQLLELPVGSVVVKDAYINLDSTDATTITDASDPEYGLGTTTGIGAISSLTTTMENIMAGVASVNWVSERAVATPLVSTSGSVLPVWLNMAAVWPVSGDTATPVLNGTIVIDWDRVI